MCGALFGHKQIKTRVYPAMSMSVSVWTNIGSVLSITDHTLPSMDVPLFPGSSSTTQKHGRAEVPGSCPPHVM